ncbi:MAG: hypothetical protein V7L23_30610 [Nostoc sp.]|uniref:hypothetical protein n=1 Tax=Nostoc sp. TaxID=1180 RepID=UPI002FF30FA4
MGIEIFDDKRLQVYAKPRPHIVQSLEIQSRDPDFSPHFSKPALVQESRGAGERGEFLYKFFPLCPSAPLHLKLVRNAGGERLA